MKRKCFQFAPVLIGCFIFGTPAPIVCAHETDQFSMPNKELADLGDYLNEYFIIMLETSVERLNKKIDRGFKSISSETNGSHELLPRLAAKQAYSPRWIAKEVKDTFGSAVLMIEGLEHKIKSWEMKEQYPDKILSYQPRDKFKSIYNGMYFPLDPRNITTFFFASTIRVYNNYLGTDKIGHFADMGYHYYKAYRRVLDNGRSEQEALKSAIRLGIEGPLSEKSLLGYVTAGAFSNADLASNYAGFLFYRNLTEATAIKGIIREPMLVRDGSHWRVASYVRGEPKFFERFVSNHFNESLNPSLWQKVSRKTLRKKVTKRCAKLLEWYQPRYGDQDPVQYFTDLAASLRTYYGEDYGHHGKSDELVHIGNTCGQE